MSKQNIKNILPSIFLLAALAVCVHAQGGAQPGPGTPHSNPPIAATSLTNGTTDANGTDFTTAPITPSANALVLLLVGGQKTASGALTCTVAAAGGLTWVEVANVTYQQGGQTRSLWLFRAMGSNPTASFAHIITFSATVNSEWHSVDQFTGADTSGTDGSGAVLQPLTSTDAVGSATFQITLGAFSGTSNATYGGFLTGVTNVTVTPGTGFTELGEAQDGGTANEAGVIQTQYQLANDTTVDVSAAGATTKWAGIAVEIKD